MLRRNHLAIIDRINGHLLDGRRRFSGSQFFVSFKKMAVRFYDPSEFKMRRSGGLGVLMMPIRMMDF